MPESRSAQVPRLGVPLHTRPVAVDLALLGLICLPLYFLGPTTHGLTNWQEGIRALVSIQMDERAAWITPTVHGEPYLAKPPMVYWLTRLLAEATFSEVSILHLRLVVALAATAGVVLTCLAGRSILRDPRATASPHADDQGSAAWADHASFWSAAMLATGVLYARSGRIGELDIILVPFVVGGASAGCALWRTWTNGQRTHWLALLWLLLCAAGSSLTKGPPGAMVLLFASCGGPLLQALTRLVRRTPTTDAPARKRRSALLLGAAAVGVVAASLGSLSLWGKLVALDIGAEAVQKAAGAEAADNLRILVPQAPLNNLEAASYGVGLGSIAAIIALLWLLKDRPRLPRGAWVIAAWLGLSMLAMSVLGKGVPRYLTPVWPAIALLGGMWLASAIRDLAWGRSLARGAGVVVVCLALGQGLWYGVLRDRLQFARSPERLLTEVLPLATSEQSPIVAIDLWHPAIDVYAGEFVEPYTLCGPETTFTIGAGRPLAKLRDLASDGPVIALMRDTQPPNLETHADLAPPADLLRAQGFEVSRLTTDAFFLIDAMRTTVSAYRITLDPAAGSSADRTADEDPDG